jgi:cell division protein ZapE
VFLDNVPRLTLQERDQVRRFITLIDTLYEQRTRLVLISEMEAAKIFDIGAISEAEKKKAVQDEIFAWDRTVSRLIEMQSMDYLIERAQDLDKDQFWAQQDL